jgi:hypothetical protein
MERVPTVHGVLLPDYVGEDRPVRIDDRRAGIVRRRLEGEDPKPCGNLV